MGLFREKVKQYLTEKYYREWFDAALAVKTDGVKKLINKIDINVKSRTGNTALICASIWGLPEIVELLLKAGADVNAQNNNGVTALMCASDNGHKEIVELLKSYGAKE